MKIICTISIIFTVLVLGAVGYLYFADPFGINVLLFPNKNAEVNSAQNTNTNVNIQVDEGKNPALSPAQEKALEDVGIDPAAVPSVIPPGTEQCFVDKLGKEKVDAIKSGAVPTAFEILKARPCIEK